MGGGVPLQLPDEVVRNLSQTCQTMLGAWVGDARQASTLPSGLPARVICWFIARFSTKSEYSMKSREAGEDTDLYRRIQGAGIAAWNKQAAVIFHVVPSYRLEEDYFRLKAMRGGSILARRDLARAGA